MAKRIVSAVRKIVVTGVDVTSKIANHIVRSFNTRRASNTILNPTNYRFDPMDRVYNYIRYQYGSGSVMEYKRYSTVIDPPYDDGTPDEGWLKAEINGRYVVIQTMSIDLGLSIEIEGVYIPEFEMTKEERNECDDRRIYIRRDLDGNIITIFPGNTREKLTKSQKEFLHDLVEVIRNA
jgi:hypothetical protein